MADKALDYFSKTLEKGLRLLALFDEEHSRWSQKEIAGAMGMNTTSVYRLVNTFVELGYLVKDGKTKQLRLGPMAVALGHRLLLSYDLRRMLIPVVEETSQRYGLSIEVALFANNTMVLVCGKEQQNTLSFHKPGSAQELYCTAMGKAFLAHLPADEQGRVLAGQSFLARTPKTLTDRDQLLARLPEIRQQGYASNDEEFIKGLISIGAPLFNPVTRAVVGGVSFDSTIIEMTLEELVAGYATPLLELARRISAFLPGA